MSKHILKLFSPSGTRTILVFLHQTLRQNSDGNPLTLNVGVKCSLHCRPVLQDGWVGARCPLSNTTPHLGPLGLAGLPTFAFLPPPCHCNFVNFNSILKYYFHQPTQSTKSIGPYKIDFLKPFITKQCSQARPSTGCLAARRLGTHYPQAFTREPAGHRREVTHHILQACKLRSTAHFPSTTAVFLTHHACMVSTDTVQYNSPITRKTAVGQLSPTLSH